MAEEIFSRFDAADYLESEEDIAVYLETVMAEAGDDPAVVTRALAAVARARSLGQLARETGLSKEGIRKALAVGGNPTFATVAKIAQALGLRITLQSAASGAV